MHEENIEDSKQLEIPFKMSCCTSIVDDTQAWEDNYFRVRGKKFKFRDQKIKVVEEVSGVISIYITYAFGRKKFYPLPLEDGGLGWGPKNLCSGSKK